MVFSLHHTFSVMPITVKVPVSFQCDVCYYYSLTLCCYNFAVSVCSMLSHVVTFSQVSVFFSSFKAIMLLLVQLREAISCFSCRIIYNFDI